MIQAITIVGKSC